MGKHLQVTGPQTDGNLVQFGTNGFATDSGLSLGDLFNGIVWSGNLLLDSNNPVYATSGIGYTAEGGVTSKLIIPNSSFQDDRIGAAADSDSALMIELADTTSYYNLTENQSIIMRYDESKSEWLIENSYLPVTQNTGLTTFYVDGFATDGGNGSITLPFNSILDARDATIGSGTAQNPDIDNVIIRVVSGVFQIDSTENLFVESTTYEFSDGVIVESVATSGTNYLFDNRISTSNPSNFNITGDIEWFTNNKDCGFIYADVRNQGSPTSSTNYCYIGATIKSATNNYDNSGADPLGSASIPIIKTGTESTNISHNNAYKQNLLLNIKDVIIADDVASSVIHIGKGSYVEIYGNISRSFGDGGVGNRREQKVLNIDSTFRCYVYNCTFGASVINNYINIWGTCCNIEFNNCVFNITGSDNALIKPDDVVVVLDGYESSIRNHPSSDIINGIKFHNTTTTTDNFNTPASAYFIKPETATTPIAADFSNCNLSIDISSDINVGFYSGEPSVQGTPDETPSRFNTIDNNLTYYNLPTNSAGLNTGAIWNNSGTLSIV
jgi:hypothetical protein